MQHKSFLLLFLFFIFMPSKGFTRKDEYHKSLSEMARSYPLEISCDEDEDHKETLDESRDLYAQFWEDSVIQHCENEVLEKNKATCIKIELFKEFASHLSKLSVDFLFNEKYGESIPAEEREAEFINHLNGFLANMRDALPDSVNFNEHLESAVKIIKSNKYPQEFIKYQEKSDGKVKLNSIGYYAYASINNENIDISNFLKEHKFFIEDIKNYKEPIPYPSIFCKKKKAGEIKTNVDNLSTCFFKVQSFQESIERDRRIDFERNKSGSKSKNTLPIVHGVSAVSQKDCGRVTGTWSSNSSGGVVQSTLMITKPNKEKAPFDVKVLRSYINKVDLKIRSEIETSKISSPPKTQPTVKASGTR